MSVYIVDTETTGLTNPIQPVEIAWIKLPETVQDCVIDYNFTETYEERFKPTRKVELDASKVTGIYMKDLLKCKTYTDFAAPDWKYMIGHNIAFDHRVLSYPDVTLICTRELAMLAFDKNKHKGLRNHKLGTLVEYFYPEEYKKILENAHGAMSDCISTYYIFIKILEMLPGADTWDKLASLCGQASPNKNKSTKKALTVMPFGKHKGVRFSDIPTDYLSWLYKQDGLSPSLVEALKKRLKVL